LGKRGVAAGGTGRGGEFDSKFQHSKGGERERSIEGFLVRKKKSGIGRWEKRNGKIEEQFFKGDVLCLHNCQPDRRERGKSSRALPKKKGAD